MEREEERIEALFRKLLCLYRQGELSENDIGTLDYILHHHVGKTQEKKVEVVVQDEYGVTSRYQVLPESSHYVGNDTLEETYTFRVLTRGENNGRVI